MLKTISEIEYTRFLHACEQNFPQIHMYSENFISRRVPYCMEMLNLSNWDAFITYISAEKNLDSFLSYFLVPASEFFRDSEFWATFYNKILPKRNSLEQNTIWIPDCVSGHEIISLCILLEIAGIRKQTTILAGCVSKKHIEKILSGIFSSDEEKILHAQYNAIGLPSSISKYYTIQKNKLCINPELLSEVSCSYTTSITTQYPPAAHFVLYRNMLLYMAPELHHRIITHIYNILSFGGYMALGIKEGHSIFEIETLFKLDYNIERIYRKK
jgi:chemotaxis protein methyltransferase CheR